MRVDDLARAAGVSKRTLYEQFLTKEHMACEALARRLERLGQDVDRLSRRRAAMPDEPAQLRAIITLIWQADAEPRPAFFRDLEASPALAELVEAFRRRSDAALDRVIRSGTKHGRFRRGLDPRLIRRMLVAAVAAMVPAEVLSEQGTSPDQALSTILDVILNGVAAV
jgi:AcrR family transcriptional regulator